MLMHELPVLFGPNELSVVSTTQGFLALDRLLPVREKPNGLECSTSERKPYTDILVKFSAAHDALYEDSVSSEQSSTQDEYLIPIAGVNSHSVSLFAAAREISKEQSPLNF